MQEKELTLRGEKIILSPLKGLYWPREKALIIADVHLGKTALFRQHGIPVSSKVLHDDLDRLSKMIGHHQPQKLIVAGDMFHQDFNTDLQTFTEWRNTFERLQIILAQGNHDKLPMLQYRYMGIDLYKPNITIPPFQIIHQQTKAKNDYLQICGHIHPGLMLQGATRKTIKLPCFRISDKAITLPAFSAFTGLDTSKCDEECDYFVIAENKIVEVKD